MADGPPYVAEPMPVQLTRMEGVLNQVADRVSDLRGRVDSHETWIGELKSLTQTLKEGAVADREKAEALALALKEAKEAVESTALQESNKAAAAERENASRAALGWSPVTRVFAVATAGFAVLNIWQVLTGK